MGAGFGRREGLMRGGSWLKIEREENTMEQVIMMLRKRIQLTEKPIDRNTR